MLLIRVGVVTLWGIGMVLPMGVMKMQTAVVAVLNCGEEGSGGVYCKLSICFHYTVSEQSMLTCSVSLPQPISPQQTLSHSPSSFP